MERLLAKGKAGEKMLGRADGFWFRGKSKGGGKGRGPVVAA